LYVQHGAIALMVDPWLLGSAYGRSWWNFPPVDRELAQRLRPTHIFLTHIHWDHFHGPSLRAYGKDTAILIPEDRYDGVARDLRTMGFNNVTALAHRREFALGDKLSIRPYLFFPMTDTALVIHSPQVTLLDANDCKIVGLPPSQITRDYPRIDFALRSHSSANPRVCHHYLDRSDIPVDDRETTCARSATSCARCSHAMPCPLVSRDGVLGIYQGCAETGPRALGHRSILANPCNPRTLENINCLVKFRERIRPLAPMATREAAWAIKLRTRAPVIKHCACSSSRLAPPRTITTPTTIWCWQHGPARKPML
jgi:hypothetical protein